MTDLQQEQLDFFLFSYCILSLSCLNSTFARVVSWNGRKELLHHFAINVDTERERGRGRGREERKQESKSETASEPFSLSLVYFHTILSKSRYFYALVLATKKKRTHMTIMETLFRTKKHLNSINGKNTID